MGSYKKGVLFGYKFTYTNQYVISPCGQFTLRSTEEKRQKVETEYEVYRVNIAYYEPYTFMTFNNYQWEQSLRINFQNLSHRVLEDDMHTITIVKVSTQDDMEDTV